MGEYRAVVEWSRESAPFTDKRYSRGHRWRFDGGIEVPASASPAVVPPPWSVAAAVDPEEAFVASLSACHMLTFIDIARHHGFAVEEYEDDAVGVLARNADGRRAITTVTLHPRIRFNGPQPAPEQLADLHHRAHEACFIANSVRTVVTVARADANAGA
jgi:organic hydroperoxide reductase OsmC/OhrA